MSEERRFEADGADANRGDGASEMSNDPTYDHRLEVALRAALLPEEPPAGFAVGVEKRIAALNAKKPTTSAVAVAFKKPGGMTGGGGRTFGWSDVQASFAKAAVLLLAVTVPLGWRLHHQAEMARGEAAKQQVLLAFRITGSQLRSIEERTQAIHAGAMPRGDSQ